MTYLFLYRKSEKNVNDHFMFELGPCHEGRFPGTLRFSSYFPPMTINILAGPMHGMCLHVPPVLIVCMF